MGGGKDEGGGVVVGGAFDEDRGARSRGRAAGAFDHIVHLGVGGGFGVGEEIGSARDWMRIWWR